jgi:hypothetical protein
MTRQMAITKALFAALSAAVVVGCANKAVDVSVSPTEERLYTFGKAYIQASGQLGRGPKSLAEVKPFLPPDAPADLLRSPGDGEEFVVLWGVDFNKLPPGPDPFYVGAYEKIGSGGKRYVLRFPIGVVSMTDAELHSAVFPLGFKPPR